MTKQLTSVFAGILLFIAAITFFSSVYIVDETKQVFVTQFGKIVRGPINGPDKDEAGLYFRLPFIQEVHLFEKRYLEWDGDPNQVTTKDKLFIFIDTYARWRIVDAKLFFEKVRNEPGAQQRLLHRRLHCSAPVAKPRPDTRRAPVKIVGVLYGEPGQAQHHRRASGVERQLRHSLTLRRDSPLLIESTERAQLLTRGRQRGGRRRIEPAEFQRVPAAPLSQRQYERGKIGGEHFGRIVAGTSAMARFFLPLLAFFALGLTAACEVVQGLGEM